MNTKGAIAVQFQSIIDVNDNEVCPAKDAGIKMGDIIVKINDKKYYPIYTSQLEMNKDQKCKNKKGSVYSFDDYSRMCLNQDKLDGIIINPYHKERSIVLNKDVIQHIRTIKEKNIKTYAKAKSYLKDRKRRQKYEIDYES